jgi:hypothetical protein
VGYHVIREATTTIEKCLRDQNGVENEEEKQVLYPCLTWSLEPEKLSMYWYTST